MLFKQQRGAFMNKLMSTLYAHPIFEGIREEHILLILQRLRKESYQESSLVYGVGETNFSLGMVLKGSVSINKVDYWGNRSILAKLGIGELFAEAFVFARVPTLPVSILAEKDSEVLFFDWDVFLKLGSEYPELMRNMMRILAQKSLFLTKKIEVLSNHKIRDRVLSFLFIQAKEQNQLTFTIKMNRNELAAFLAVDRSALSNELAKMKREGILEYSKNTFTLNV